MDGVLSNAGISTTNTTEIIDLSSNTSVCSHTPNLPFHENHLLVVGGLDYENNPLVCGGYYGVCGSNLFQFSKLDLK